VEAVEVLRLNSKFSLEVHKERVPIRDAAMPERHIAALKKVGLKSVCRESCRKQKRKMDKSKSVAYRLRLCWLTNRFTLTAIYTGGQPLLAEVLMSSRRHAIDEN
jgi:hypothetical protein